MSLQVSAQSLIQVLETLEGNAPFASSKTVTHSALNKTLTLSGSTTPAVTKYASKQLALTDGAATLDLTALTGWGTNGANVDATNLKLQLLRVYNPAANTGVMNLAEGASNGYEALGDAWSVDITPGAWAMVYLADDAPDVDGTHKTIDITGSGTEVLDIELVFG